jgi:hypothetical protein
MNAMGLELLVVLALVAGIGLYLWSRRAGPKPVARPASYRCVGIATADPTTACDAFAATTGLRYLSGQAPRLPLPACTAKRCTCTYVHYDDRRAGQRRATLGPAVRSLHSMDWEERRRNRGRRKTDRAGQLDEDQMRAAVAEKRRRAKS